MKKTICRVWIAVLCVACLCGCARSTDDEQKTDPPADTGIEALADTNFSYGFTLHGPDSRYHAAIAWDRFQLPDCLEDPLWRLGTWGCFVNYWLDTETAYVEGAQRYVYPARPAAPVRSGEFYTIDNGTTRIGVRADGALRLEQNSGNEYGVTPAYASAPRASMPRKEGEAWPHCIIEQFVPNNTRLSEMERAVFSMKFRIERCVPKAGVEQNDGMHAAQFQWIILVRCDDPAKPSYGKSFWFALPLFDNRMRVAGESLHGDGGKEDATSSLIYTVGTEHMLGEVGQPGKTYEFSRDMLPEIKKAFAAVQARGQFADCTLSDMRIENTNIGWELPGAFDAAAQIDDLSLKFYKKQEVKS